MCLPRTISPWGAAVSTRSAPLLRAFAATRADGGCPQIPSRPCQKTREKKICFAQSPGSPDGVNRPRTLGARCTMPSSVDPAGFSFPGSLHSPHRPQRTASIQRPGCMQDMPPLALLLPLPAGCPHPPRVANFLPCSCGLSGGAALREKSQPSLHALSGDSLTGQA